MKKENKSDRFLTANEMEVLKNLANAWNSFLFLQTYHPDDQEEFRRAIHSAQYLVLKRLAQRINPKDFPIIGSK